MFFVAFFCTDDVFLSLYTPPKVLMRWWNGITDTTDMSLSKPQEMLKDKEAWGAAVHGVTKSWARLSNWTTATKVLTINAVWNVEDHCSGWVLCLVVACGPLWLICGWLSPRLSELRSGLMCLYSCDFSRCFLFGDLKLWPVGIADGKEVKSMLS